MKHEDVRSNPLHLEKAKRGWAFTVTPGLCGAKTGLLGLADYQASNTFSENLAQENQSETRGSPKLSSNLPGVNGHSSLHHTCEYTHTYIHK